MTAIIAAAGTTTTRTEQLALISGRLYVRVDVDPTGMSVIYGYFSQPLVFETICVMKGFVVQPHFEQIKLSDMDVVSVKLVSILDGTTVARATHMHRGGYEELLAIKNLWYRKTPWNSSEHVAFDVWLGEVLELPLDNKGKVFLNSFLQSR